MSGRAREAWLRIDPQVRQHMRVPFLSSLALLALLGVNVLLGTIVPFAGAGYVEIAVAALMVAIVLLVSMEVIHEPGLVRIFSLAGFFWLAIMFGLTAVDYVSR